MAQKQERLRVRIRMLARRYGLRGAKGVALACIALVVVIGAIGALRLTTVEQVTVERKQVPGTSAASAAEEGSSTSASASQKTAAEPKETTITVHVDGAVASPGVYTLKGKVSRVNDAINAAGGLTGEADTHQINLASPIADGQKVYVAKVGEGAPQNAAGLNPQAEMGERQTSLGEQDGTASGSLVNINTASAEELQTLAGIGEATSTAIVKDREDNGPFETAEDLMRVSGIGQKKFEKIRDKICV